MTGGSFLFWRAEFGSELGLRKDRAYIAIGEFSGKALKRIALI
jgi:hypothetical protein